MTTVAIYCRPKVTVEHKRNHGMLLWWPEVPEIALGTCWRLPSIWQCGCYLHLGLVWDIVMLSRIMWCWCDMLCQIPQSSEGKAWYSYVDPNVTAVMLEGAVILWLTLLTRDGRLQLANMVWHICTMQCSWQIVATSGNQWQWVHTLCTLIC